MRILYWMCLSALAGCAADDGAAERRGGRAAVAVDGASRRDADLDIRNDEQGERSAIVFFGTSLTAAYGLESGEGFPAHIQARIDTAALPYRVIEAGVSGETTAGALQRIDWVLRGPLDVLVLETGANDGLRGLRIDSTLANISAIIERVRAARPGARVYLVQMEAPPNLGASYTSAYRAMFPRLAADHRVELIPFLLEGVAGVDSLNLPDGIHPNALGQQVVAGNVWRAIAPLLERRSPASGAPRGDVDTRGGGG